jgi:hypothetical protein
MVMTMFRHLSKRWRRRSELKGDALAEIQAEAFLTECQLANLDPQCVLQGALPGDIAKADRELWCSLSDAQKTEAIKLLFKSRRLKG